MGDLMIYEDSYLSQHSMLNIQASFPYYTFQLNYLRKNVPTYLMSLNSNDETINIQEGMASLKLV